MAVFIPPPTSIKPIETITKFTAHEINIDPIVAELNETIIVDLLPKLSVNKENKTNPRNDPK